MKKTIVKIISVLLLMTMPLMSFGAAASPATASDLKTATPEVEYIPERETDPKVIEEYLNNGGLLHTEGDGSKWAGGISHSAIATRGGIILKNDKGTTLYNKINESIWLGGTYYINAMDVVAQGAVSPDDIEKDTAYEGHFYGAAGTNFLGQSSPTAYTRFNNHYYNAKVYYAAGNKFEAYTELGMAIHYMSDLCNPHHAGNLVAVLSFHTQYESWVADNLPSYLVTTASSATYDYVRTSTFKAMSDNWSALARAQIANVESGLYVGGVATVWIPKNAGIATEDCYTRAQRAAAGLLYRFLVDTGRA